MNWSDDALDEGQTVLARHAEDLYAEAERIALRAEAGAVGKEYVRQAALHLNLARPGGAWGDIALGSGGILLGAAAGVGATLASGATISTWVAWSSLGVAVVGTATFAVGAAVKVIRR